MTESPAVPVPPDPPASPALADALGLRPGYGFAFTGSGAELFVIQIVNALLTMVTLGIYYPWARIRLLKFLIGSLAIGDDPLTFRAEGGELLWGVLRAFFLFLVPLALLAVGINWPGLDVGTRLFFVVAFYFLLFVFLSYSLMGSLRYRASRTTWRGIRFGFTGRFAEFGAEWGVRMLLQLVTLGIAYPFVATWRRAYVITHSRFGGEHLGFDGDARELFGRWVLCWLLVIPTLGLSLSWYHGHQQAYFWNHTTFAGGRFHSSLTGGEWVGISLINALLIAFTFGLGGPFAYVNMHREFFGRLALRDADLSRVTAAPSTGDAMGEGALDVLDADTGVDI